MLRRVSWKLSDVESCILLECLWFGTSNLLLLTLIGLKTEALGCSETSVFVSRQVHCIPEDLNLSTNIAVRISKLLGC